MNLSALNFLKMERMQVLFILLFIIIKMLPHHPARRFVVNNF